MLGHHRHSSETPFILRFAGGPDDRTLIVVFRSSLSSSTKLTNHNRTKQTKTRKKKRCQSWTSSDKTFLIRACALCPHGGVGWSAVCDYGTVFPDNTQLLLRDAILFYDFCHHLKILFGIQTDVLYQVSSVRTQPSPSTKENTLQTINTCLWLGLEVFFSSYYL